MDIVVADIGGTHARFAIATVADGAIVALQPETTMRTADHASLQTAWEAFGASQPAPLPRAASIAVACPVSGEVLKLTNNPWLIRPAQLGTSLGLDRFELINDFVAVGHAVAQLPATALLHICGPDLPLPAHGIVSIIGPGTGLGVAQLLCAASGYDVLPTEGGHIDFAPLDAVEDAIVARLRSRLGRVSVERVVSGPGLRRIYEALAAIEGRPATIDGNDDRLLWSAALAGQDSLASAALERFCLSLGAFAGDAALAHGAQAVVIGGGLGSRLKDRLADSGFAMRFVAKGRFESHLRHLPVKLIDHPQPGLYGAAAAFALL